MTIEIAEALKAIRQRDRLTHQGLAIRLGASLVSVARWEDGTAQPSPQQREQIIQLLHGTHLKLDTGVFASRGARISAGQQQLSFGEDPPNVRKVTLLGEPSEPVLSRITDGDTFISTRHLDLDVMLRSHAIAAPSVASPPEAGMSAGKNTYTYDAHTYHTKVPPQGIAELLKHYLPTGGLILDPFAGSGMTAVAAAALGYDSILNELSPAACFIASRFVSQVSPLAFEKAIERVLDEVDELRRQLYTTTCRECGRKAELRYMVWSYRVLCSKCRVDFNLWDVCRRYGRTVREHKILSEFDCPSCGERLHKRRLERIIPEPVMVGYICCGDRRVEVTHPPDDQDLALIQSIDSDVPPAEGYYPKAELPDGVNLNQPRRHGLDRTDKLYTRRNLVALSHIWRTIHRLDDAQMAAQVAFTFTSLYRRVTRLSEFRFWGGSGNTARLNVPFIYDEPNVFIAFDRKAKTILDHLRTTAQHYSGSVSILRRSATDLAEIPDESIDLVFTDPPFGGNINYSEMNFLWEAWLGQFTDTEDEAIVNRVQGKDVSEYEKLMTFSLKEAYRVLRAGRWMLLVFMNSSSRVWESLRAAIQSAGFVIVRADVFDKQHATFKQFVSENTAGADLVLHCLKPLAGSSVEYSIHDSARIAEFLASIDPSRYSQSFLHVKRASELDLRRLYSEWIAQSMIGGQPLMDFPTFRSVATELIAANGRVHGAES